jgi:hypothetical protein
MASGTRQNPKARKKKAQAPAEGACGLDITVRLRQTRANMLGTGDEQHYWDCIDGAIEIERLRTADRINKGYVAAFRLEVKKQQMEIEQLRAENRYLLKCAK